MKNDANDFLFYSIDVSLEMGSLGVIPASHLQFKEGTGHGDVSTGLTRENVRVYTYVPLNLHLGNTFLIILRLK